MENKYKLEVNSSLSNQELIDSLKIKKYVDEDVVSSMPRSVNGMLDIEIFKIGKSVTNDELENEFSKRGLKAIDPYSLALFYKDNFDKYDFLGSHWKDENDEWCYIAFYRLYDDGRYVRVYRYDRGWFDDWWFAGVRKSSEIKPSVLSKSLTHELKEIKRPQYDIGSLIMHCGNIYNEQGVEITKEVGEYISKKYNLKQDAKNN